MPNVIARIVSGIKSAISGVTFGTMNHDLIRNVFGGNASISGRMVNETSAMTLSAAWSCMRILSETIGSLPWAIYRIDPKTRNAEIDYEHPLADVLVRSPNVDMTSTEFREALVLNLCQAGNAYSLKEATKSRVTSLYPIRPSLVVPKRRDDGTIYFSVNDRGRWEDYPRDKIWHVKGFGDGVVGLSPLSAARESMGFALATEEFGSRFFAQGGRPSGVVTIPNWIKDPDQRKLAREQLNQMLGGLSNAHKFALFEGGMKPEPWGEMPLKDMEFLLLRQFSVDEICRFYRVPPHMVAQLAKATFSNIEQQAQEFVSYTLLPYFARFESSALKWLFSPEDRRTCALKFNVEGLLRGDSAARAALWPVMLQNGVMSRNEVRAKENLNRVDAPGMDDYTVQLAMAPIGKIGAMADATIAGKKNPPALPRPPGGGDPETDPDEKSTLRSSELH